MILVALEREPSHQVVVSKLGPLTIILPLFLPGSDDPQTSCDYQQNVKRSRRKLKTKYHCKKFCMLFIHYKKQ